MSGELEKARDVKLLQDQKLQKALTALDRARAVAIAEGQVWQAISELSLKEKLALLDRITDVVETAHDLRYPEASMDDDT